MLLYRSYDDVKVSDLSLMNYIATSSASVYLPHSGAPYAKYQFHKAKCPIVERLVNSLMLFVNNI